MDELRELYQQVIIDHSKSPHNFKPLPNASRKVEGYNPLCGDRYTVYVNLNGDTVKDITFEGSGCAISKASASLMTDSIKGKKISEALKTFDQFRDMVSRPAGSSCDARALGKLAVFAGVAEFPARVKCAILAWHTLRSALEGKKETISTE